MATASKGMSSRSGQQGSAVDPMRPSPLVAALVDDLAAISVAARACCSRARPARAGAVLETILSDLLLTRVALVRPLRGHLLLAMALILFACLTLLLVVLAFIAFDGAIVLSKLQ